MQPTEPTMYKVTYSLYGIDYAESGEKSILTDDPFGYIDRLKKNLEKTRPNIWVGSYVVEPIYHLKVIK